MAPANAGELMHEIEMFVARYPGARWSSASESAYRWRLQLYDIEDIRAGLHAAAEENRRVIPDLTTVAEHVAKCARDRRRFAEQRPRTDERREALERLQHVPTHPRAAAAYIEAASSPYERFARQCEVESRRVRLDPTTATPRELGARRMAALGRLLGSGFDLSEALEEGADRDDLPPENGAQRGTEGP
jgi:hypothetical protein